MGFSLERVRFLAELAGAKSHIAQELDPPGLKPGAFTSRVSYTTRLGAKGNEFPMEMTWINGRLALGGGIWTDERMAEVAQAGITHIIDMQLEFDDTALAEPYGIRVLWNPVDDDFRPKSPEVFRRGVEFALAALEEAETKLYVHCAAGVHRAPMMLLAVLRASGWTLNDARRLVESRRPVVDFAHVYVDSVEDFIREYATSNR